jgi:glycosyltransferase involved in cell wall biosynthesis
MTDWRLTKAQSSLRRIPLAFLKSSVLPGFYSHPKRRGDLADIMLDLLDSPSERDDLRSVGDHRLIAKGFDRCQQFSWDKTAVATVAVYRSLL